MGIMGLCWPEYAVASSCSCLQITVALMEKEDGSGDGGVILKLNMGVRELRRSDVLRAIEELECCHQGWETLDGVLGVLVYWSTGYNVLKGMGSECTGRGRR